MTMQEQERGTWKEIDLNEIPSILRNDCTEAWLWKMAQYQHAIQVRHLKKNLRLKWGKLTHLILKKVDMDEVEKSFFEGFILSQEPNYEEKLEIVKHIIPDYSSKSTMEVFPPQREVVDNANLYHLWSVAKDKFPFECRYDLPEDNSDQWTTENIGGLKFKYSTKIVKTPEGRVALVWIKRLDGQELIWKEKQMLKNKLFFDGDTITAIELINDFGVDKNATLLVYLPFDYDLDFGLM